MEHIQDVFSSSPAAPFLVTGASCLVLTGSYLKLIGFKEVISNDYPARFRNGCFPISSLRPGILNKILMYISQHKHLGRGKGSQLNSSSK